MSDIVERLRDEAKESETRCRCMCHEAAAEIERLRARVEELEGQHKGLVIQNAILRSRPDLPADRIPAADRVAKLEDDRDRWKTEALAARHFISMGRIEAWQPDGFHPGIPPHIEYKAARAANGEVGQ